jgi:hypothetical protein
MPSTNANPADQKEDKTMTVKEQLIEEIQQAPDSLIEAMLDFLLFAKARRNQQTQELPTPKASESPSRPIWELFEEFADQVPEEVAAKLPTDGAVQHDHYLYGAPKRDQ